MLERSECSCQKCQLFCKVMPSYLLPEDIIPYMGATGYLNEDELEEGDKLEMQMESMLPWAKKTLLASDGAIVKTSSGLMQIPTLVPNNRKNGSCIHYNQQSGLCPVHDSAPFGCRFFSCDMGESAADILSKASVERLAHVWETLLSEPEELATVEAMYVAIWLELEKTGSKRKRTTVALRKRFASRLKELEKDK